MHGYCLTLILTLGYNAWSLSHINVTSVNHGPKLGYHFTPVSCCEKTIQCIDKVSPSNSFKQWYNACFLFHICIYIYVCVCVLLCPKAITYHLARFPTLFCWPCLSVFWLCCQHDGYEVPIFVKVASLTLTGAIIVLPQCLWNNPGEYG